MSTTTPKSDRPSKPALSSNDRLALDRAFAIDSRGLAVVRILLAGLVLFQSVFLELSRPRDPSGIGQFFTQYGDIIVIPFALMMLAGWKTKYAVILCWLAYSLRIRAGLLSPEVEVSIGDVILSLGLFWSMFLPLGRHLSVDSRQRSSPPVRFLSVASAGLLLQIFVIYLSSGLLKSIDEWVIEASAMETVLSHPNYETTLGVAMLSFPALLAAFSVATVVLEVAGSVLIILPGKTLATRRLIVVPMFITLHMGIAVFMGLGIFPYVLIAVWLVYLPSRFWDRVWGRFSGGSAASELMIDRNGWRNAAAMFALVVVAVSNVITWLYFPALEGSALPVQTVAAYLVLYQQWAMFSIPSSLP